MFFCDEVPVVRALRVMERTYDFSWSDRGGGSFSSAKWELLDKALVHVSEHGAEDGDSDVEHDAENESKRNKMGRRSRQRKAKALAKMPRTPSLVSQ